MERCIPRSGSLVRENKTDDSINNFARESTGGLPCRRLHDQSSSVVLIPTRKWEESFRFRGPALLKFVFDTAAAKKHFRVLGMCSVDGC